MSEWNEIKRSHSKTNFPHLQLGNRFFSKKTCRKAVGNIYKVNLKKERKMKNMTKVWIMASMVSVNAWSGESVTSDLDKCITQKMISSTAKGAVTGALMGFLAAKASGEDKEHERKAALIGAAAGGVFGYVKAWNKAVDDCKKEHPDWVVESDIKRSPNYDAVVAEFNYKPPQKNSIAIVRPLQIPEPVKPGDTANIQAKFVILTPDGGEAKVKIDRKFFVVADGQEEPLSFPGRDSEDRVVENGEQVDEFNLPIGKDVPVGTKVRVQYAISLNGASLVSQSGIIEVK